MDFNVEVDTKALEKALLNLPKTSRKLYLSSLRSAAELVRKDAESNLNAVADKGYATGTAEKNVRVYNLRKYKGNYRVGVHIKRKAVNQKKLIKGEPVRIGLYASVLEYGKEGQPPRSWIRKAIRENTSAVYSQFTLKLRLGLNQAVAEARRL